MTFLSSELSTNGDGVVEVSLGNWKNLSCSGTS